MGRVIDMRPETKLKVIADSGTSLHVAPSSEHAIPGSTRNIESFRAHAAFGGGTIDRIARFRIDELEIELDMHIVEGAGMYLFCNHLLYVEHGIRFDSYTNPDKPEYELRDGKRVPLSIRNNVPVLELKKIGSAAYIQINKSNKLGYTMPIGFVSRNRFSLLHISNEDDDDDVNEVVGAVEIVDNPMPRRYDPEILIEESAKNISKEEIRAHNLCHAKSERWCFTCRMAKMRKKGRKDRRKLKVGKASPQKWGDLMTCDSVAASVTSVRGYSYRQHMLDVASGWVTVRFTKGAPRSLDTLEAFRKHTSGKPEIQAGGRFHSDNGPEMDGEFKRYLLEDGRMRITRGLPDEPTTDGEIERINGHSNRAIRAVLLHAGLPITFWCYADEHWARIWNYEIAYKRTGKRPIEFLGDANDRRLKEVPFGCFAIYRVKKKYRKDNGPTVRKEEETGRPGIVLGKARGGYLIMDLLDFIHSRLIRVSNTDDTKIDEHVFPGRIYGLMRKIEVLRFTEVEQDVEDIENGELDACQIPQGYGTAFKDWRAEDIRHYWAAGMPYTREERIRFMEQSVKDMGSDAAGQITTAHHVDEDTKRTHHVADDNTPDDDGRARDNTRRVPKELQDYNLPGRRWGEGPRSGRRNTRRKIDYKAMTRGEDAYEDGCDMVVEVDECGRPQRTTRAAEDFDRDDSDWNIGSLEVEEQPYRYKISVRSENKKGRFVEGEITLEELRKALNIRDEYNVGHRKRRQKKTTGQVVMAMLHGDINIVGAIKKKSFNEAANSDKGRQAIIKELSSNREMQSFDVDNVKSIQEVKEEEPNATFARTFVDCTVKGAELEDASQKDKARLLIIGNKIYRADGSAYADQEKVFEKPVGLQALRAVTFKGLQDQESGNLSADMDVAYLQAYFSGVSLWVEIDPRVVRDEDFRTAMGLPDKVKKIYRPVVKVIKSVYGSTRGAYDLGRKIRQEMRSLGWMEDKDVETNLYYKDVEIDGKMQRLVCMFYVDDARIAGNIQAAQAEFREISKLLKFKKETTELGRFVGIRTREVEIDDENKRGYFSDQIEYAKMCIETYEATYLEKMGTAPSFETRDTPITLQENKAAKKKEELWQEGVMRGRHLGFIGMLLWLARNTRPELMQAVNMLSRFTSSSTQNQQHWSKLADIYLHQVMSYLNTHLKEGTIMMFDRRDQDTLEVYAATDSDYGGCAYTGRSTSGYAVFITGVHGTRALMDWGAKRQVVVANSSTHAELIALNYATNMSIIPITMLAELVFDQRMAVRVNVDNKAAIEAIEAGFSVKLRYLKKLHKMSLARLHEIYFGDESFNEDNIEGQDQKVNISLRRVGTLDNVSDIFTKDLASGAFIRHKTNLNVVCENDLTFV